MSTVHPDAGIVWFAGLGFRPAVWTPPHRADHVDPPRLVPAPDADLAYLAKWEAPASSLGHGFGFVLWPDTQVFPSASDDAPAQEASHDQVIISGGSGAFHPHWPAGPLIPGPWHPPVDYPCNCITHPPINPPLPEPAPVPLPASAGLLLAGMAVLFIIRRFK